MATAKKLPSGTYRVQVIAYIDEQGKKHKKSFSAASKKEAELKANLYLVSKNDKVVENITVENALKGYIETKRPILSPSTYNGYVKLINTYPKELLMTKLNRINHIQIDRFIGEYSKTRRPKSVKNAYSLLKTACNYYGADIGNHKLPQKIPVEYYVPSDAQVKALINDAKIRGDKNLLRYYMLGALCGMRESEILGASVEDISDGILHIKKAKVKAREGYEEKTTKTVASDRYIDLPQCVLDVLPKTGDIITINPRTLENRHQRTMKRLGYTKTEEIKDSKGKKKKVEKNLFRFHDLRHYFASLLHAQGYPDYYIMKQGGWSNDTVLKGVYRSLPDGYSQNFDIKRKELFNSFLDDNTKN